MLNRKATAAIACFATLAACQKINVTGISDARTVEYFSKNPEIAIAISAKCDDFEQKGFSKMSSADQTRWRDSTDGINCKNAGVAKALRAWNERQRALEEADRKYK